MKRLAFPDLMDNTRSRTNSGSATDFDNTDGQQANGLDYNTGLKPYNDSHPGVYDTVTSRMSYGPVIVNYATKNPPKKKRRQFP